MAEAEPTPPARSLGARLLDVFEPEAPAERLGAVRVLVGLFATIYLLIRLPGLWSPIHLSANTFAPVGFAYPLSAPAPAWLLGGALAVAVLTAVPFLVGWRFAITGPLFAASLLFVTSYRNSFGMVFHTENLLVVHVAVLACTDAAAALSFDAKRRGEVPAPDRRFGWALVALNLVTVIAYFLAGVAKLRVTGMSWAAGDVLRNHVAYDNLRKHLLGDGSSPFGGFLVGYPALFRPFAAVSLVIELLAPLALFSRKLGKAFCVAIWGFHLGVLLIMWILFPYPLSFVAFAPFFAPEARVQQAIAWLGAKVRRAPAEPGAPHA